MKPKHAIGETVQCRFKDAFYPAKILKVDSSKNVPYKVHYVGWNDRWDEWVNEGKLRPLNEDSMVAPSAKLPKKPSPGGKKGIRMTQSEDEKTGFKEEAKVEKAVFTPKRSVERKQVKERESQTQKASIKKSQNSGGKALLDKAKAHAMKETRRSSSSAPKQNAHLSTTKKGGISTTSTTTINNSNLTETKQNEKQFPPFFPLCLEDGTKITQSGRRVKPVERSESLPTAARIRQRKANKRKIRHNSTSSSTTSSGGGLRTNRNTSIIFTSPVPSVNVSEKQSPKQSEVENPFIGGGLSTSQPQRHLGLLNGFRSPSHSRRKRGISGSTIDSIGLDFESQEEGTELEDTHPIDMVSPTSAMLSLACDLNRTTDSIPDSLELESIVNELRDAGSRYSVGGKPYDIHPMFSLPGPSSSSPSHCTSIDRKIEEFSVAGGSFFDPRLDPPDLGSGELFGESIHWWNSLDECEEMEGDLIDSSGDQLEVNNGQEGNGTQPYQPQGPTEREMVEMILSQPAAEEVVRPSVSRRKRVNSERPPSSSLPRLQPKTPLLSSPQRLPNTTTLRLPPGVRLVAGPLPAGVNRTNVPIPSSHSHPVSFSIPSIQIQTPTKPSSSRFKFHDIRPLPPAIIPLEISPQPHSLTGTTDFVEIPASVYADHCYGKVSPAQREMRREQQANWELQNGMAVCEDQSGTPMLVPTSSVSSTVPLGGANMVVSSRRTPRVRSRNTKQRNGYAVPMQVQMMSSDNTPRLVRIHPNNQSSRMGQRTQTQQVFVVENGTGSFRTVQTVFYPPAALPRIVRNSRIRTIGGGETLF